MTPISSASSKDRGSAWATLVISSFTPSLGSTFSRDGILCRLSAGPIISAEPAAHCEKCRAAVHGGRDVDTGLPPGLRFRMSRATDSPSAVSRYTFNRRGSPRTWRRSTSTTFALSSRESTLARVPCRMLRISVMPR